MKKSVLKYSFLLLLSTIALISSITAATYIIPSSIDATGTNDVTQDLLNFFASVPDGSTINFPSNALYRIEGTLYLKNRTSLTLEGNNASLFALTDGNFSQPHIAAFVRLWPRNRAHIGLEDCINITISNLSIKGSNPYAGLGDSAYNPLFEAQHGIDVFGGQGLLVEGIRITDIWGDFVYLGKGTGWPSNMIIRNSYFERNGRQGFGIVEAQDILIENNYVTSVRRAMIDIEPNGATGGAKRITIKNNTFGSHRLLLLSMHGRFGTFEDIYFLNNTVNSEMQLNTDNVGNRRSNFSIIGNRVIGTTAWRLYLIDDLQIINNTLRLPASGIPDIKIETSCNVIISGNNFSGAALTNYAPYSNCSTPNNGTTPSDTTSPIVNIIHTPQSNIMSITPISLTATASDTSSVSIDIFVDGSLAKSCSVATTCVYQTTFSAGNHTYYASATDSSNNVGTSITTSLVSTAVANDVTPPSAVILKGRALSDSEIELRWNASTDDVGVAGYNIYRNSNLIETTIFTTFKDSGLIADTQYEYFIETYDGVNHTNTSQPINVTTLSVGVTAPRSSSGGSGGGGGGIVNPFLRTSKTPSVTDTRNIQQAGRTIRNILRDFNRDTGIKQIEVRVNVETDDVGVTVSKYENVPAAVSVKKQGKVYKYLQFETENLVENLESATITSQVEKTWATENKLEKEEIALFKFNETSNEWIELPTNFTSEEEELYYYESEVDSFSFFLIGQKETSLEPSQGNLYIGIIAVLAVLIVVIFFLMIKLRNHVSSPSPKFEK